MIHRKRAHYLMMVLTIGLGALVLALVDLTPHVDENFFFSSENPKFREARKIDELFPSKSQLIISAAAPDIHSVEYSQCIGRLTRKIQSIDGVAGVKSITAGPKDLADALKSPWWKRLLIGEDEKSTNLIVLLEKTSARKLIPQIETAIHQHAREDLVIRMAGVPYVVEMIRRNLLHDFAWFSVTAVLFFGFVMLLIFRSWRIVVGMMTACLGAIMATLLIQAGLGIQIGILTANLSTIVFVMTLSQLVFLTSNWQTLSERKSDAATDLATTATCMTRSASFWCMVAALLGFGSLLFVPAKPLRELGTGGVLAAGVAFACTYGMYPPFLRWAVPKKPKTSSDELYAPFWSRRFVWPGTIIVLACLGLGYGLKQLNTDPSLLEYFKQQEALRSGLEYIDRNGGSSPFQIAVSSDDDRKLNTGDMYQKMWRLQTALENHPAVGTVISLPVIMAEGDRSPLSFLLTWENLLRIMDRPEYGRITDSFITRDRKNALFLLRMTESARRERRVAIVEDLRQVIRQCGFKPVLLGGIYYLQGELAQLVNSSLVSGLGGLIGLFLVVAWIVSRSLRVTLAMGFSLSLVPLSTLGAVGLLSVPVDIISAPATNVCIGLAVDGMIHLVFALRRQLSLGKDLGSSWVAGRQEQWWPILCANAIVAAGFAIFSLSSFPPTQRFGLVVVFGTLVVIMATLFVLPLLGGTGLKKLFPRRLDKCRQEGV